MKKVYKKLFIAAFGLLTLTACSNDDNAMPTPAPIPEADYILGSWKLNKLSVSSFINDELDFEEIDVPMQDQIQMEFTFTKDLKVEYLMAIPNTEMKEEGVGTYKRIGNELIITIDNEPQSFEIIFSSNDELHLQITDEWEEEGDKFKEIIQQKFIRK